MLNNLTTHFYSKISVFSRVSLSHRRRTDEDNFKSKTKQS